MVKKKVVEHDCLYCKEKIDFDSDRFVLLGTYNGDRTEQEVYFHFKCWVKYFNDCVLKKAKKNTEALQSKAQEFFGQMMSNGIFGNLMGTNKLKGLLDTDLKAGEFESGIPSIEEMFEKPKISNTDKKNEKKSKPKK